MKQWWELEREVLMFELGRASVDEWVSEREERERLAWFQEVGDRDLVQWTLGRLSVLWGNEENGQDGRM